MQPLERDPQELCVIQKRGKLQLLCSKTKMLTDRKLRVEKYVGQDRNFQPCLLRASARRKISVLYNVIGFF